MSARVEAESERVQLQADVPSSGGVQQRGHWRKGERERGREEKKKNMRKVKERRESDVS